MLAMVLSGGDFAGMAGVIAASLAVPFTMIVFSLKALTRRVEQIETRVAQVERTKTDKHDWAREAAVTRNKLDQLGTQIAALTGKIEATFGIGAAISRLAEEMARTRKDSHGE